MRALLDRVMDTYGDRGLVGWLMTQYRGTGGVLGRLVLQADVRWLRRHVDATLRRR
jgi:hypothetical protein